LVQYPATTGADFREPLVPTDEGAHGLRAIASGPHPAIRRFPKNTVLDEKIAGLIPRALGQAVARCGGRNQSALPCDLGTAMTGGAVRGAGPLIYRASVLLI
jgi:leucyl aminopeptidase (aminopeptidase T)